MAISYRPLRKEDQEIRVLILDRAANHTSPLRCRLEHAQLFSTTYTAISYVWGQQDDNRADLEVEYLAQISVTGDSEIMYTTIGESLGQALYHLRKEDEDLRLWADAICINQQDDVEKSWQVGLMSDIFKTSELCLVWLGPTLGNHDLKIELALEAILDVGTRAKVTNCWSTYGGAKMGKWLLATSAWFAPEQSLEDEGLKEAIAFGKSICMDMASRHCIEKFYDLLWVLSRLSWWTRVWVLQEYVLAPSVIFTYGKKSVDGESLSVAVMFAEGMFNFVLREARIPGFEAYVGPYKVKFLDHRMPWMLVLRGNYTDLLGLRISTLMELLYLSGYAVTFESTDPRDKAFALIGLSKDNTSLKADYGMSVEEIYTNLATAFFAADNASILSIPRPVSTRIELPSWALDWSIVHDGAAKWKRPNASNNKQVRFGKHGNSGGHRHVLSLEGTNVGAVSKAGKRYEECFHGISTSNDMNTRKKEVQEIKAQIQQDNFQDTVNSLGPRLSELSDLDFLADQIRCVRGWISDILTAIHDQKTAQIPEWQVVLDIVFFGNRKPSMREHVAQFLDSRVASTEDLLKPSTWLTKFSSGDRVFLLRDLNQCAKGCRLFSSDCGRIGYAPDAALEGDQIVIFYGVPTPLVIREVEPSYYKIIGPAYVYGIMDGEFFQDGDPPAETFLLV